MCTASPEPDSLRTRTCGSSADAATSRPPALVRPVITLSTFPTALPPWLLQVTSSPRENPALRCFAMGHAYPAAAAATRLGSWPPRYPHHVARNEQRFDGVQPEDVAAVLADGWTYADWVVGAKRVREVDDGFPSPGSRLHHSVGLGPLTLDDNTQVLEADLPASLLLEARARPFGRAHIRFTLRAEGGGTHVTMDEWAVSPRPVALLNPAVDPLVKARNVETLRRLERVVQARARTA